MSRVDLPSGGWIELGDPADVSEKKRRKIKVAGGRLHGFVDADGKLDASADVDLDLLFSVADLVAEAVIAAWSFDAPITADSITDLAGKDYDAILAATGPLSKEMLGLDFSPSPDPASPTVP